MANWYVSSVDWTAVAAFQISHAYSIGNIIRQLATPTVGQERVWRCTTAGTSAGSEPSPWTLTKGSTTTSGSAVFTEITGQEAFQSAGAWAAPFARLQSATSSWTAAGDNIYVAANHAETQAAAMTISIAPNTGGSTQSTVVCVDNSGTGHVPPSAGDIRATASITTTGNFAMAIGGGSLYCYGIIFNLNSGGNNNQINTIGVSGNVMRFEACAFNLLSSANSALTLNNIAGGGSIEWINTTLSFGNANAALQVRHRFVWRDTASAFSGSSPTATMLTDITGPASVYFEGLDLSGIGSKSVASLSNFGSRFLAVNCTLASGITFPALGATPGYDIRHDYIGCDSGAITTRCESRSSEMTITTEATAIHTGGASDGTTGYSWKVLTGSDVKWSQPAACWPISQWNSTTGSSKTVSFEAIINAASVLNTDQLWAEIQYLGTSSSALAAFATSGKADILASTSGITSSSAAWDSIATARANGHVYSIGDIIKVATNSGRIFFCTTGGTSAGSEPGGYASAVDGGTVSDGATCVFRAGCRMTVSKAVTPQTAGPVRVTPKVGLASTTVYIDPLLTIA